MVRVLTVMLSVAVAAVLVPARGDATMVKRLPLEAVVARAARIVHGTVVEVQSGRDDVGLPSTWVTLDVAETLKGQSGERVTFKQFGVHVPLSDGTITGVPGLPRYKVGDEVVLFLHAPSVRGFTSPVGLGQGCYHVSRPGAAPMARDAFRRAPRRLDILLSTVRRLTRGDD